MASKAWSFLLPGSGEHEVRVDEPGKKGQKVFIDGNLQMLREAQAVFTGPEESVLELRCCGKFTGLTGKVQWSLLVNGMTVEDYSQGRRASGDQSMRELRSRPDGAYLIQPKVNAKELDLNIVRKYKFVAYGLVHEVSVAHSDFVWQVLSDGSLVDRVAHKRSDSSGEAIFDIEIFPGEKVRATLSMTWENSKWQCEYALAVRTECGGAHTHNIPFCWSQLGGPVTGFEPPSIVQAGILSQVKEMFKSIDSENTGLIARDELKIVMQEIGGDLWAGKHFDTMLQACGVAPGSGQVRYGALLDQLSAGQEAWKPEARKAQGQVGEVHAEPSRVQKMPQGVSFDAATGSYQANIRVKSGRFVFLGEFRTPDEAHQRYLGAVPIHCPEKQLAPDIR